MEPDYDSDYNGYLEEADLHLLHMDQLDFGRVIWEVAFRAGRIRGLKESKEFIELNPYDLAKEVGIDIDEIIRYLQGEN